MYNSILFINLYRDVARKFFGGVIMIKARKRFCEPLLRIKITFEILDGRIFYPKKR